MHASSCRCAASVKAAAVQAGVPSEQRCSSKPRPCHGNVYYYDCHCYVCILHPPFRLCRGLIWRRKISEILSPLYIGRTLEKPFPSSRMTGLKKVVLSSSSILGTPHMPAMQKGRGLGFEEWTPSHSKSLWHLCV